MKERLFFALWPDPGRQRAWHRLGREVAEAGRPVAAANLHLTLLFLGEVDGQRRRCLEAVARQAAGVAAPFELTLERWGHWRRSRVVWLGPRRTPPPLARLVSSLRQGAQTRCELPAEAHPFRPHVTLARGVRAAPDRWPELEPQRWPVEDFVLVRSLLRTSAPPRYTVVARWPLAGAEAPNAAL